MRHDKYSRAAQKLRAGGVGSPSVRAHWPGRGVGAPNIRPNYLTRGRGVGAAALRVPSGADENQVLYSDPDYTAGEVTFLGFKNTTPIGIAGSVTAVQKTQVNTKRPFQPQDLRFPSTLEGLMLNQAQIQGTNMLANEDGVPFELMSEVTTIGPLDWITIDPATGAELTVENLSDVEDQIVRGAFWGTALRR